MFASFCFCTVLHFLGMQPHRWSNAKYKNIHPARPKTTIHSIFTACCMYILKKLLPLVQIQAALGIADFSAALGSSDFSAALGLSRRLAQALGTVCRVVGSARRFEPGFGQRWAALLAAPLPSAI